MFVAVPVGAGGCAQIRVYACVLRRAFTSHSKCFMANVRFLRPTVTLFELPLSPYDMTVSRGTRVSNLYFHAFEFVPACIYTEPALRFSLAVIAVDYAPGLSYQLSTS